MIKKRDENVFLKTTKDFFWFQSIKFDITRLIRTMTSANPKLRQYLTFQCLAQGHLNRGQTVNPLEK